MTLAIIILAYLAWIGDFYTTIQKGTGNLLITGSLVTLVSWQVATAWGIVMLCVTVVAWLVALGANSR